MVFRFPSEVMDSSLPQSVHIGSGTQRTPQVSVLRLEASLRPAMYGCELRMTLDERTARTGASCHAWLV